MTTIVDNHPAAQDEPVVDPKTRWNVELLRRSVAWRSAAGWVVVMVLFWHFLLHPIINTVIVANGGDPLAPLDPISWEEVLAIIGIPIGGAFADRMTYTGATE